MTYVVSNLHGNYQKYKALLSEISFKDTDILSVLGDIVDYGEEPMELIGDMSVRYNVYPVVGIQHVKGCRAATSSCADNGSTNLGSLIKSCDVEESVEEGYKTAGGRGVVYG